MHCALHSTFHTECLRCYFAKRLGSATEDEKESKRKKIKSEEQSGEKDSNGGSCSISMQPYAQKMMTAFVDLPVSRECVRALGDRFGNSMGKGFLRPMVVNALLSLQHEVQNEENSNSKWLKLSIGCLIRRDVCEDFQFAGYTFELMNMTASKGLPAFEIPVAKDTRGIVFASAELVIRHGCKASPSLDRRPRLLLKHLSARGSNLNEAYVLAATRRFYAIGFKKGSI